MMEKIDFNAFLSSIEEVQHNPAAIQNVALDHLEKASNGEIQLVDPSNPFVYLLEASAAMSVNNLDKLEAQDRAMYPPLATSEDQLYNHMSDADYVDRFSLPSSANFFVMVSLGEVISKAKTWPGSNYKKMVIPRNTSFRVSNYDFGLQYPIEIRVMPNNSVQVVYDVSKPSPLEVVASNLVAHDIVNYGGEDYLILKIPAKQFTLVSETAPLNRSTGFNRSFTLQDNFWYCRAYHRRNGGSWEEIKTTHSEQIHDARNPTVFLRVADGKLTAIVPQIYFTTDLIGTEIRLDIYTTRGNITVDLSTLQVTNFTARYLDLDDDDDGVYSSIIAGFSMVNISSDSTTKGGRAPLTFEQLQERVVDNANRRPVPVTENDLTVHIQDKGYDLTLAVDNVVDRVYIAGRQLPAPVNTKTTSPAGSITGTLKVELSELKKLDTVFDHGYRKTIMAETLFRHVNGTIEIVPDFERLELEGANAEEKVQRLNSGEYLYSPFLYVLDDDLSEFNYSAYYVDAPSILSRNFIAENGNLNYRISTDTVAVERTGYGYRLVVKTVSDDAFKALAPENILVQLAFIPDDNFTRVYSEGSLLGVDDKGEHIYEFRIETKFDIDSKAGILLENFLMVKNDTLDYRASLDVDFDIIYGLTGLEELRNAGTSADSVLNRNLVSQDTVVVTHEKVRVNLGDQVERLFNRARSVVGETLYSRHIKDIPAVYEEVVYETGDDGFAVFDVVDGEIVFNVLHQIGDPILDGNGDPTYKHRVGDLVLVDGKPVPVSERGVERLLEVFCIDAMYRYTTEPAMMSYAKGIPSTLVEWSNVDLASEAKGLLARTKLFLKPKTTVGDISISTILGEYLKIKSELSFVVDYYVSATAYNDSAIRTAIEKTTQTVIGEVVEGSSINTSTIQERLRENVPSDVAALKVHPLDEDGELVAFNIEDTTTGCSIAKKIELTGDGTLALVDDITVNFIKHKA